MDYEFKIMKPKRLQLDLNLLDPRDKEDYKFKILKLKKLQLDLNLLDPRDREENQDGKILKSGNFEGKSHYERLRNRDDR